MTTTTDAPSRTSSAFHLQAIVSFGVSLSAVAFGIAYLPLSGWVRAFLGLGMLYLVTSAFTLAKCVRDKDESRSLHSRIDEARLEKLLAEHDPFRTASV